MAKVRNLPGAHMATVPGRAIRMLAAGEIDELDFALLGALACYADQDGYTYPAQATLAICVRKDRSTVNRRLTKLSTLGLIESGELPEDHRARRQDGGQSVLSYRLIYDTPHRGESVTAQGNTPKNSESVHRPCVSKDAQGSSSAPLRGASDSGTASNRPTDAQVSEGSTEALASGQSVGDGAERMGIQIPDAICDLHPDRLARISASLAEATLEQRQRFADVIEAQVSKARHLGRWAESLANKAQHGKLDPDDRAEAARARVRSSTDEDNRRRREQAEEIARIEADPIPAEMFVWSMPSRLAAMASVRQGGAS